MFNDIALCNFEGPSWLLFSSNIPPLIYYSHLPIIIASLLIGFFVYRNRKDDRAATALFYTTVTFSLWVFLDSVFWASNRSDIIMFVWSVILIIEPLVYAGCLYLMYGLIDQQDLNFRKKMIVGILFLPLIVFVPTKFGLSGFDLTSCLAIEGFIAKYYTYFTEIILTLWILIFAVRRYHVQKDSAKRKEIILLTLGVIIFLVAFASGNIIGSFTENWNLAQAGLFGMPIFIGFLAYVIVRFKTFNIKLIGAQVLVTALLGLIVSLLFIPEIKYIRIVAAVTLIPAFIFSMFIVRGVRREIEQREKIEKLAADLEKANIRLKELDKQKTEFVSFASHQLRSPLTALKGYASLILEGDYGEVTAGLRDAVHTIFESSKTLATVVEDYLNISRIELGSMKYNWSVFDWKNLAKEVYEELKPTIEKAKADVSLKIDDKETFMIKADQEKFKQVLMNIIDNSIKYTPKGYVEITLAKKDGRGLFAVKDSGVGIPVDTLPKLFQKFTRADNASSVNIRGTGLGLFVAKEIMNAHGGRIWAESEGEGKGAQFYVELTLTKT